MLSQPLFQPRELSLVHRAYAEAVLDLESAMLGGRANANFGEACFTLALRIVAEAADGERDVARLKHGALRGFKLSRASTARSPS
jgi:hypothetical protein